MKNGNKKYYIIICLLFGILTIRLFFIYSNSDYYKDILEKKTLIYVNGSSAPRGKILDTNGKVLVDNIGVKTIYYNKLKEIDKNEEIEISYKLANILTINEGTIEVLKEFWLVLNNNGKELITDEEYELLNERKLTNDDLESKKSKYI